MTKKQKEFIAEAKIVSDEEKFSYDYKSLYVFNSGKMYNGFWGKGLVHYNQIIIIGITKDDERINITGNYQCDAYDITNRLELTPTRTDIPNKLGCICHYLLPSNCYFKLIHCLSDVHFEVFRNV